MIEIEIGREGGNERGRKWKLIGKSIQISRLSRKVMEENGR